MTILTVRASSPVSRAHYRAALIIAIVLVATAIEILPFARRSVAPAPGLQAAFVTTVLCLSAITSYVIFAQFAVTRSLPLLVLGSGYWFGALMNLPYLLTAVGVNAGPLNLLVSSDWLWICGHLGFSFLALAYLVLQSQDRMVGGRGSAGRIVLVVCLGSTVVSALLLQLLSLPHLLPRPTGQTAAQVPLALSAFIFFYALVVTRSGGVLNTWLSIALLASLLDTFFASTNGQHTTVSWYVSFLARSLVSFSVLTAFLVELTTGSARLATLAGLDGLTGLPNRRGLDERLELELDGGRRRKDELAVLMIDIDYFKDFNDRFGHAVGDDALRIVAKVIDRSLARTRDFAARYGGEEFAVVLPDTDHEGALLVAERIRAGVARHAIGHQVPAQIGTRVTVSIGVAAVGRRDLLDAAHILEAADRALYAAKEAGRNCVRDTVVAGRRREEGIRTA
ncbi:MAG TPA: sensor domain-containing diguanylate cyclase [Candidatus Acidoferrales bacterium]|nr:sensor domain-containing diguanylate cyclase [Candidatus Acidoferrales bacterium]